MGVWLCFALAFAGYLRQLVTGRHETFPLRFCQVAKPTRGLIKVNFASSDARPKYSSSLAAIPHVSSLDLSMSDKGDWGYGEFLTLGQVHTSRRSAERDKPIMRGNQISCQQYDRKTTQRCFGVTYLGYSSHPSHRGTAFTSGIREVLTTPKTDEESSDDGAVTSSSSLKKNGNGDSKRCLLGYPCTPPPPSGHATGSGVPRFSLQVDEYCKCGPHSGPSHRLEEVAFGLDDDIDPGASLAMTYGHQLARSSSPKSGCLIYRTWHPSMRELTVGTTTVRYSNLTLLESSITTVEQQTYG
ncbi:hypothetical protein EDD16DRAFT_1521837 [Pisolithus croceorrhizus]|nr:hypothetical protein EDD16DRAFT_1521837 [Pisolithus croceorrhizus]